MQNQPKDKGWSPYLAGALTGVVMILSVWFAGKYFGASTTFVRTTGMIEKIFSAGRVVQMDYFIQEAPKIDWQWMFVVGILIGSFIAARTSASFQWQAVSNMWQSRFGASRVKRGVVTFAGGLVAMFGARLADG
jgi:uncharacterized protein